MKKYILFSLFLWTICGSESQIINHTNYYQYCIRIGITSWIRPSEAVPVIIDQLLKCGISYSSISIGDLVRFNDSTEVVLTVGFIKQGKLYGFIYTAGHYDVLNQHQRDFIITKENYTHKEYVHSFEKNKESFYMDQVLLPVDRIFLLKETCYWFQIEPDGTDGQISKEVALKILREDILYYLKDVLKATK
jgi:hypothetical protein